MLVDHPYHCQNECCEFSHEREVAFGDLVDDVAAAAVPAILRWAAGYLHEDAQPGDDPWYTADRLLDLADEMEVDPDGMCPNCVTPWKCNGPHVIPGEKEGQ